MYSFLRGEMIRMGISVISLAKQIGVSEKTMRNKLNGDTDFTLPEAQAIRGIVSPGERLEILFASDKER